MRKGQNLSLITRTDQGKRKYFSCDTGATTTAVLGYKDPSLSDEKFLEY